MSDQIFYVNSASFIDVSVSASLYVDVGTNVDFSQATQVSGSFVGSLLGNSTTSTTSSYSLLAATASFTPPQVSASYALSASHANNSDISISSSFATNAISASRATSAATASYVNSGQRIKSGIVSGSSFAGNPQIFNVLFTVPFPTLYTVTVSSDLSARSWLTQNVSSTGFTINANSKTTVTGLVYWQAIAVGEFNS